MRHLDDGRHILEKVDVTLTDRTKKLFKKHSDISSQGHIQTSFVGDTDDTNYERPKGFGLKVRRTAKRFTKMQTDYLNEIFDEGARNKQKGKAAPSDVVLWMRKASTSDGKKMFTKSEYLTESQIKGYFGRRSAKIRNNITDDNDANAIVAAEDMQLIINDIREAGIVSD